MAGCGCAVFRAKNRFYLAFGTFSIGFLWTYIKKAIQGYTKEPSTPHGSTMALGPPIVGMPHPAMAGPASVVQAMWGNLPVLGLFKAFCIWLL